MPAPTKTTAEMVRMIIRENPLWEFMNNRLLWEAESVKEFYGNVNF